MLDAFTPLRHATLFDFSFLRHYDYYMLAFFDIFRRRLPPLRSLLFPPCRRAAPRDTRCRRDARFAAAPPRVHFRFDVSLITLFRHCACEQPRRHYFVFACRPMPLAPFSIMLSFSAIYAFRRHFRHAIFLRCH
jgi:hypothetical protein